MKHAKLMELDVKAAADLMAVPENTLYRWIRDQDLPAHRVNDQVRFNRAELLEWATAQGVRVSPALIAPPPTADATISTLAAALTAGGVYYDVPGTSKQDALSAAIGHMPLPADVDRELLLDVILARESLGSTGIGDGIAIPHVRNPIVMHIAQPLVTLCFLKTPVAFGALDDQPVHTLFTIVCPVIRIHLHLISRLAFALRQPAFAAAVRQRAPQAVILAAAASTISAPHAREGTAP